MSETRKLHIKVADNLARMPGITYWMQSSPSVNIFEAIDESLDYLTVGSVADQQIQKLRLLAIDASEIQLPNQYVKTGNQVSPFILEGRTVGKGDLTIIVKKDGNEICRKSVKLDIRPITEFYEKYVASITMDDNVSPTSTLSGTCRPCCRIWNV